MNESILGVTGKESEAPLYVLQGATRKCSSIRSKRNCNARKMRYATTARSVIICESIITAVWIMEYGVITPM